jgi:hypothetical protein
MVRRGVPGTPARFIASVHGCRFGLKMRWGTILHPSGDRLAAESYGVTALIPG